MSFKAYCTDLGQGSAEIHRDGVSTPHGDAITSCILVASHFFEAILADCLVSTAICSSEMQLTQVPELATNAKLREVTSREHFKS
jgi:hypothetical protein